MERTITGLHGIEEALKAGKQSGRLFMSRKSSRLNIIREAAAKAGVEIVDIPPAEMNRRYGPENRGAVLVLYAWKAQAGAVKR